MGTSCLQQSLQSAKPMFLIAEELEVCFNKIENIVEGRKQDGNDVKRSVVRGEEQQCKRN